MTEVGQDTAAPTRVLVSYAHDSDAHREIVREFWQLLRQCGIDARIDLTADARPQLWTEWMRNQLREVDFVLIVASPAYRRRAEDTEEAGKGWGVRWEVGFIEDDFYRRPRWARQRYLPVQLPGRSIEDFPDFLHPASGTVYRVDEVTQAGIERLLRVLTHQPVEVPEPGPVPVLPPGSSVPHAREFVLSVRLEDGRVISRATLGGVVLSERDLPVPHAIGVAFEAVTQLRPARADRRLVDVGHRLRQALLDEAAVGRLSDLLHRSAPGRPVDVIFEADGPALRLPYELLRLPDGALLATAPNVCVRRRLPGLEHGSNRPSPGPLKVLMAVGAPDEARTESPPFDIEAAQQAILDVVGDLAQRADAQVTILEVGDPAHVAEALRRDAYHVVHLSAHGAAGVLELENEEGGPVRADAEQLIAMLRRSRWPVPLVVLSSCSGAEGGTDGLAATLVARGMDRVLAMQAAVTDAYATALARRFYQALAENADSSVADALAEARRRVEEERQAAVGAGGRQPRPEYGLATLLCAGGDPPLRDATMGPAPLHQPTEVPAGGSVRELKVGQLIGRRRELRTVLTALRGGTEAVERWGALSGVVLTGIGGIGKTALAGRVLARLREQGWLVAVHEGRWNPSTMFTAVAAATDGRPDLASVRERLESRDVEDTRKLDLVGALLRKHHLLLLLDDFEQNLTEGGDRFAVPGFAEVMAALCGAATRGRILVTCRYPMPGELAPMFLDVPLRPLSASELGRLLLRLPALRDLEVEERRAVIRTIGGHPRLIEFVDAILRGGRANLIEVASRLWRLARDHGVGLDGDATLAAAIDGAVLLGSRDILLDQLLGMLSAEEREVALQAAVSREPLTLHDLAVARWGVEVTGEQSRSTTRAAERLVDLTLLSPVNGDELVVHAWVAEALAPHQGAELVERRHRAFCMHRKRVRDTGGTFGDLLEIARHQAAAGRYDELVQFALSASDALTSALSLAAFTGEVVPMVPTGVDGYLALTERQVDALLATGSTAAALARTRVMLDIATDVAMRHPESAAAQHNLGVASEKLGDLLLRFGNGAEAERLFRRSLAIAERVRSEPGLAPARRRRLSTLQRLGNMKLRTGSMPEAERLFREVLAIARSLATDAPDDAEAQRDLSVGCESLGTLMARVGIHSEAERLFRESLDIRERLARKRAGGAEQADLAASYERMGDLLVTMGNDPEAEGLFRQSLAVRERLATEDAGSADARRDRAIPLMRLGLLLARSGRVAEAEAMLRETLAVTDRVADADPDSAELQRDLSAAQEGLADLVATRGDWREAEALYREALAIRERLARADPDSAEARREIAVLYERLGDQMLEGGDKAEGERLHRAALGIREQLALADPGSVDVQHDFSVSCSRLAHLVADAGNLPEAERLQRQSMDIATCVAREHPDSVEAQRRCIAPHQLLGDLLVRMGNDADAERLYREGLAIAGRVLETEPNSLGVQRDRSVISAALGRLTVRAGNLPEAERLLRESVAIVERLTQFDPNSAGARRDLIVPSARLSDLLVRTGNLPEAERLLRRNLDIWERLAADGAGRVDDRRAMGACYSNLGDLMVNTGNLPEAERLYRAALAVAELLAEADPDDVDASTIVADRLSRLGATLRAAGNADGAERCYREALAVIRRRADARPAATVEQTNLGVAYRALAELLSSTGRAPEAARVHREHLAWVEYHLGVDHPAGNPVRAALRALAASPRGRPAWRLPFNFGPRRRRSL